MPARRAARSQTAFTTAPAAIWMAPFSGPSQRNWLSPTSSRANDRVSATASSIETPRTSGSNALIAALCTSLPRPTVKTMA